MFEIAQNLEQMAARFRPIILIGPGLACLIVGLFVWLGGLGLRKLLIAVIGVVAGGICGIFVLGWNIISAMILAAVAAGLAIIFEKIFITILAAGLAVALGLVVLARPYTDKMGTGRAMPYSRRFASQSEEAGVQDKISEQAEFLSIRRTAEIIREHIADFITRHRIAWSQMPAYSRVAVVASGMIFIVAGVFLWRLTSALCCATLGTLLIFAGMILLLLYKGAAPISGIHSRTSLYAAAFITMTAFGTIEQLLLCQRTGKKWIRKKQANKEDSDKTATHWRTR